MSLTGRIIARASAEMPDGEDTAAPVRLMAKDRGVASRFGLRRLAAPPVLPRQPVSRMEDEADIAHSLRRSDAPAEEVQPIRRAEEDEALMTRRSEEEPEAQAIRRAPEHATTQTLRRTNDAEEAQPIRRSEDEDAATPLRRAEEEPMAEPLRRETQEETAEPIRRTDEMDEAQPLRRREAPFDAGLQPEMPADELRHDTAGASLDGTARAVRRDVAAPAMQTFLAAEALGPTASTEASTSPPDSRPDSAPSVPAPQAAWPMDVPDDEGGAGMLPPIAPTPQPLASSERPKVVIDQIDVVVAAPAAPATAQTAPSGARALLARRYRRGI